MLAFRKEHGLEISAYFLSLSCFFSLTAADGHIFFCCWCFCFFVCRWSHLNSQVTCTTYEEWLEKCWTLGPGNLNWLSSWTPVQHTHTMLGRCRWIFFSAIIHACCFRSYSFVNCPRAPSTGCFVLLFDYFEKGKIEKAKIPTWLNVMAKYYCSKRIWTLKCCCFVVSFFCLKWYDNLYI